MRPDDANQRANQLLHIYGLDSGGWRFTFNHRTSTAAVCSYKEKTIQLSLLVLPHLTEQEVDQALLHEIARAITPGVKHGKNWQSAAEEMGTEVARMSILPREIQKTLRSSSAKQVVVCPSCSQKYYLLRKKKYLLSLYKCKACGSQLG
jgi:predicted SprT family Zn-dependent metalloprotease